MYTMRMSVLVVSVLLTGCALFQKTTKTKVDEQQELNRQTQINKLAVKTGQRETNVYTYWPDGSVYQWQREVEQVDEARLGRAIVEEKAVASKEDTHLKTLPSFRFLYLVLGFLLICVILWYVIK